MGFTRTLLGDTKSLVLKHGSTRISLVCIGKMLSVYRIPRGVLFAGRCVGVFTA